MFDARRGARRLALGLTLLICSLPSDVPAQQTLSSRAVLRFTFDEENGPPVDTAATGAAVDVAEFKNGVPRLNSPFAGQRGKSAVITDGPRRQFVQVADSADLDQAQAATISFFYLHLGSAEDASFHGLFAKRVDGAGSTTYGINFSPKSDLLQAYLNDGSGFKTAQFGFNQILGVRKPVYLTTTYEVGDAPGDDADTDRDDVLIRLYVNGKPQAPRNVPGTIVSGNDTWLTNLNLAGLLNDTPLTIGSSTATIEFTSGVIDEFSLIPAALTPDEVGQLFAEVAGADAATALQAETLPAQSAPPALTLLSQNGLTSGTTTTLIIQGANLQPAPEVVLPVPGAQVTLGANSNPNQVEAVIALPAMVPVGHYSLRIRTAAGVSNALPVAVDSLPVVIAQQSSAAQPLTLPVAVSGNLSGAQISRSYFHGKSGQRLVADVEARRIGAAMTPVLEIKTARGTPLRIEWSQLEHGGDARAVVRIPQDGIYYVELHDLSYNAPGVNPYRLKIGDLKLADVVLGGVTLGTRAELPVSGSGMDLSLRLPINLEGESLPIQRQLRLPAAVGAVAPAPRLNAGVGPEYSETPAAAGQLQTLDVRFSMQPRPIGFTGLLAAPQERDLILLKVDPGQRMRITANSSAVNSSVDPQVQVLSHPQGNLLASAENPGSRMAVLDFTVPGDQSQIQILVRDLRARGGEDFRYRLLLAPVDRPDFSLTLSADRVQIAADGSSVVQVTVDRQGYNGPIKLRAQGDPSISIVPDDIPAGATTAWVTLRRTNADSAASSPGVMLVGDATDIPELTRMATVPADSRLNLLPEDRYLLAIGLTQPVGAQLELANAPVTLYRGVDVAIPVSLKLGASPITKLARLSLLSTESTRLINPNDPNQGKRPRVDANLFQVIDAADSQSQFRMTVPTDIADPSIDFVIKAELVENPFAQNVVATIYSAPFRMAVQNAVTVELATNTLDLKSGTEVKFTGKLKRAAEYKGAVTVQILNLPQGVNAPAIVVPADQEAFEIVINPGAFTAAMDVPNVVFRVNHADANQLQADTPLPTKITP